METAVRAEIRHVWPGVRIGSMGFEMNELHDMLRGTNKLHYVFYQSVNCICCKLNPYIMMWSTKFRTLKINCQI